MIETGYTHAYTPATSSVPATVTSVVSDGVQVMLPDIIARLFNKGNFIILNVKKKPKNKGIKTITTA